MHTAVADGETVLAVVRFIPPAVQNRKRKTPVENRFLPAGAAGFEGPSGIVQPHIHALYQMAGDVVIVILDENDSPHVSGIVAEFCDAL